VRSFLQNNERMSHLHVRIDSGHCHDSATSHVEFHDRVRITSSPDKTAQLQRATSETLWNPYRSFFSTIRVVLVDEILTESVAFTSKPFWSSRYVACSRRRAFAIVPNSGRWIEGTGRTEQQRMTVADAFTWCLQCPHIISGTFDLFWRSRVLFFNTQVLDYNLVALAEMGDRMRCNGLSFASEREDYPFPVPTPRPPLSLEGKTRRWTGETSVKTQKIEAMLRRIHRNSFVVWGKRASEFEGCSIKWRKFHARDDWVVLLDCSLCSPLFVWCNFTLQEGVLSPMVLLLEFGVSIAMAPAWSLISWQVSARNAQKRSHLYCN